MSARISSVIHQWPIQARVRYEFDRVFFFLEHIAGLLSDVRQNCLVSLGVWLFHILIRRETPVSLSKNA